MITYKIVRFYYTSHTQRRIKPCKTMERGLTLEQAQKHCNDPKTRKEGVYFDGYAEE